MMNYPLLVPRILERARVLFPEKEIVTRAGGTTHRCTYRDLADRVDRLANALAALGVGVGDRVGTFAWNTYRHLEGYFAAPALGAIVHTINIRLAPDDLIYIINHAQDKVILIDHDLVPIIEALAPQLPSVKHYIIMTDDLEFSTPLPSYHIYEELLTRASDQHVLVEVDENAPAGLCYTSATTGRPKGVMYTHRGLFLHSMAECQVDILGFRERDVVMAIVPMFHANCWGIPYSCTLVGATQVMPGVRPNPQVICQLIEQERVTFSAGVPTIWVGVLDYLEHSEKRYDFSSLREIVSGGSAVPTSLIQAYWDKLRVSLIQAYGMTEATPLVSVNRTKSNLDYLSSEEKLGLAGKQGLVAPGLEMKLVDDKGSEVPRDGQHRGELLLRGPWVAREYYNDPRTQETFIAGWYHSGDIATVDEDGYIQIVDRVKDMVKSGGEWISSVDLETAIIAHPAVLEAAVIGVPHPTWQERPLACVVSKAEFRHSLTKDQVLDFLRDKFARWWLPDDVVFLEEIPKTSVGKFDKKLLRERFKDYRPRVG
jgi:fatty-acyl-CoA synthase